MLAVLSGGIEPEPKQPQAALSLRNKGGNPCALHSPFRCCCSAPARSARTTITAPTSVTYNSDVAENAAADIGNTAQNIAADIGNDVKATGDKIENKVGNKDVNVNVNADVKTENKQ